MSRELSFFSDYHQKENIVTNYCGLIMKMIYEDNPKGFEEVLVALTEGKTDINLGPKFKQQLRKQKSIPDLVILQDPIAIFFENKLSNWFYNDQVERHISAFGENNGTNILFLMSNDNVVDVAKLNNAISKAKQSNVLLQPISYEDFIDALSIAVESPFLRTVLDEFTEYLDRSNLLPKWKYLLDVVNCAGSLEEVKRGVYVCPDSGGAYSHRRARYFGAYADKKVSWLFQIDAVVVVDADNTCRMKWNNTENKKNVLIERAVEYVSKYRKKDQESLQVFLLSNRTSTDFLKTTSGGMPQSKIYFWDIANPDDDIDSLANKLNGKSWNEFR